ncbi:MAG: hypothetical protein IPF98_20945 [Gemmatimonadetes bacterium]|nr:hypothetical protein [Gemmatimonadota bacterium]
MRLRTDLLIAGGVAAALLVVAYATGRRARGTDDPDRRASSFLVGREGTRAMADAAERLGVSVTRWRQRPQALVAWVERAAVDGADGPLTAAERRGAAGSVTSVSPVSPVSPVASTLATLAILEPSRSVTPAERLEVIGLTTRAVGADLVLAGGQSESVARCYGYLVVASFLDSARVAPPGVAGDSTSAFVHGHLVHAGETTTRRNRPAAARDERVAAEGECPDVTVVRTDTLLVTTSGKLAMLRLTVAPYQRSVVLIGDVSLVRNRTLRHSSTSPLVLDAVLPRSGRLVFDEYHQGFGTGGSMARVAIAWSAGHPVGWMVWQLLVVGLLALGAGAVRFGPVRAAIPRARRSSLEHVRALATALAAAQGHRVAIGALVRGLRRRLAVSTDRVAARDDWRPWLAGLAHHAPNTQVRDAAERLERLADHPESETAVLSAANAVEDVWHSLRP